VLDETDMAALFGLEMADNINSDALVPAASKPSRSSSTAKRGKVDVRTKPPTAKASNPPRRKPAEAEPGRAALVSVGTRAKRLTRSS
jgi:hypothetical protein